MTHTIFKVWRRVVTCKKSVICSITLCVWRQQLIKHFLTFFSLSVVVLRELLR